MWNVIEYCIQFRFIFSYGGENAKIYEQKKRGIFMEITSLTNQKVKQWVKYKERKYREKEQYFLIEGEHLIQEANKAGLIDCLIVEQGIKPLLSGYSTYEVTQDILKKLSEQVSGCTHMAVCHYPSIEDIQGDKFILLDDVQDPGNVGTIIRTAYSFGYDAVYVSPKCADVYNEKVIRSTQGAVFHLPVIRMDMLTCIQNLKENNVNILATSLRDASPLSSVQKQKKCALIFGNEGAGVSEEILNIADKKVFIEMNTFESLNVAVAAGICMYYFI